MESKAKLLGHPIHQILIVFPLGLLITSLIFDVIFLLTRSKKYAFSSFSMLTGGLVGGLTAAIFGLIDWLAIPEGTRAKTIGMWHGLGNALVTLLFGTSWLLRREEPHTPEQLSLLLSLLGGSLAGVTGWLGGELVDRLGVGVAPGAHLDAPSSLSGLPATENSPSQHIHVLHDR